MTCSLRTRRRRRCSRVTLRSQLLLPTSCLLLTGKLLPAHCSLRTAYPLLLTPCQVLASYADKLQAWHARFVEGAKGGAALYAHWESQLQACYLVITPRDSADCLQACPLRLG